MTGKYSSEELRESTDSLLSSLETVNRRGIQNADDIVDSAKDYVYRCLNSDVDSVYALLSLLRNKQVILCSKLLSSLLEALRLSSYAHQQEAEVDEDALDNIALLMEELLTAGKKKRELLIAELEKLTTEMVRANQSPSGALIIGTSASTAKAVIKKTANDVLSGLSELVTGIQGFTAAPRDYMAADFESISASLQVRRASLRVEEHLNNTGTDAQQALLDSVVSASLVRQASTAKRDIKIPKYEGEASTLPGSAAQVFGGTDPFIVLSSDEGDAQFSIGGNTDALVQLVADLSTPPSLSFTPTMTRTEAGNLYESLEASDKRLDIGIGPDAAYLKPDIVADYGSVHVLFSLYDLGTEELTQLAAVSSPHAEIYPGIIETGDLVLGSDPSIIVGSINFLNGQLHLDASTLVSTPDQFLHGDVHCTYDYYALGNMFVWDASWVGGTWEDYVVSPRFNLFTVIVGNYVYHAKLDQELTDDGYGKLYPSTITTAEKLATVANSSQITKWVRDLPDGGVEDVDAPVYFTESGGVVTITANQEFAGSAVRIAFPSKREAEVNAVFGPARYTGTFDSINQIYKLGNALGNTFGSDTAYSTISVTDDDGLAKVSIDRNKIATVTTSYKWDYTDSAVVIDGLPTDVAVGDDVYETSVGWHAKITSVDTESGQCGLEPQPPLSKTILKSVDYDQSVDATIRVTRDRPRVTSVSNEAGVTVSVLDEGLGFSGEGSGESLGVVLGSVLKLDEVSTEPGYNIKPRDVVSEYVAPDHYREIGRVASVSGNSITVVINDGVSYQYPFVDVRVEPLGLFLHNQIRLTLQQLSSELGTVDPEEYKSLANTYAVSGAAQGTFVNQTLKLITLISSVRNTYLKYDAHVVNTVNMLLEYLKQEKLTVLSDMLVSADFSGIPRLTPKDIASQGDIEAMLDKAAELFGSNVALVEGQAGFNVLTDYKNRGEDTNKDIFAGQDSEYLG